MLDSWQGGVLSIVEQFLPEKAQSLLDYGCGNGYMGYYFYKKGFSVDLADISDFLINKLKIKYRSTQMGIIQTDTPEALFGRQYDVIIAWSFFHHLNPNDWTSFLYGFWRLLNNNGILVIGGWDISDVIIKKDGKKARFTGSETWYVNPLIDYVDDNYYKIVKNDPIEFSVSTFSTKRIIRCYVLKKNNNQNK
jgi:SAM-dependent methyltransferase